MNVLFSKLAATDLEDIGDYIALDNPNKAVSFINELKQSCFSITQIPYVFPIWLKPEIRRKNFGKYAIFYEIKDDFIFIRRILHSARNFSNIKL